MKVLITGASGFIGERLVKAAITKYGRSSVVALSSRPCNYCDTIVYEANEFEIKKTDLKLLQEVNILLHAGSFTPKSASESNDTKGCTSNIIFTEKLFNLPFLNLEKILYLSTLDVYAHTALTTEKTPTLPTSLYGFSKLYCENLTSAHASKKSIKSQILRIGHVYGPGEQQYKKFIPNTFRQILAGKSVELWGDGSDLRSFIYIDDVVHAVLNAVSLKENVGIINIAGSTAKSILQILDLMVIVCNSEFEIIARESSLERRDSVFDTRKCKEWLLPQETDLLTGLRNEYEYLKTLQ